MTAMVIGGLGALGFGAMTGWGLVRWTNLVVARLWAIFLLLLTLGLSVAGLIRVETGGMTLVVAGSMIVLPALIGSVVAMILTEWRMSGA